MRRRVSLYTTGADPHRRPALTPRQLWANIVLHAIFADRVLMGDAQALTNRAVRALLITDRKARGVTPGPLAELFAKGMVAPLRRTTVSSFSELAAEQRDRMIENAPPADVASYIDELLQASRDTYVPRDVSRLFKERVLDAMEAQLTGQGRLARHAKRSFVEYVHGTQQRLDDSRQQYADPLLHHDCRIWLRAQVVDGKLSKRGYEAIDALLTVAYSDNVPVSAHLPFDRYDRRLDTYVSKQHPRRAPADLGGGDRQVDPRFVVLLDENMLCKVTPHLLQAIREIQSRVPVVQGLERLRAGRSVPPAELVADMNTFMVEVEFVIKRVADPELRESWLARRKSAYRAVFGSVAIGAGIDLALFMADPTQIDGPVGAVGAFISLLTVVLSSTYVYDYERAYRQGYAARVSTADAANTMGLIHGATIYDWATKDWKAEPNLE